jgi:nucleoside phosphorylase/tetratricopeptide (TPR) repeat protein
MFRELQEILRTAGMPFGDEELLDALWLMSRLPQGPGTLLAALWAAAQQTTGRPSEHAVPGMDSRASRPSDHRATAQPSHEHNPGAGHRAPGAGAIPDTAGLTPLNARRTGNRTDLGLRVPGLKALGSDLAFSRALRPLKRNVPSTRATELDEEATAAAQAEARVPQVILRPQAERWLRLALIIDSAASMLLWERHCTELLAVFERSGVFRQIEVHQVHYQNSQSTGSVTLTRPWGNDGMATLPPGCVTDPSGRTMVIVVTDGAAAAWRDGRMYTVLQDWAAAGPTALIHVLPRPLWASTGITADTWHITAPRAGAPNTDWHVTHPILPSALSKFGTAPIPVLELTPPGLTSWATALTTLGRPVQLRLWEPCHAPTKPAADATASALAFNRTASPQAVRLAAHLAAMAPVTVPVMQLVHSCLPGSHRTATLAEVFLSGLLTPLPSGQPRTDFKHRLFDFTTAAKDLLLDTVPTAELTSCSRRVGEQMETLVGRSAAFPAWLLTPSQQLTPTASPQPFAHVGQSLLTRLGRGPSSNRPDPDLTDPYAVSPYPTAVIVTTLFLEYDAVRALLTDVETLVHPSGARAERGRLPGTPWYVALPEISEGTLSAATITERVRIWLRPEALLFVGIAGGLKDEIKIGDVVVATKVYGIHVGKQDPDAVLVRPEAWRLSHRLEQTARHALRGRKAFFRPIVVGHIVVRADTRSAVARLQEHYNDAVAIAMDSVSIALAAHLTSELDALIIQGISDMADTGKHAQRSGSTAAHQAAAAAIAVLRELQPRSVTQHDPETAAQLSDVLLADEDDAPSAIPGDSQEPPPRWSGEPSHTRLVMIARTTDPALAGSRFDHLGTGFLLAPRLVLTATHILSRHGRPGTIKVRNKRGTITADGWINCRVVWKQNYGAALLLAEEDLVEPVTDGHFSTPRWAHPAGGEPLSPCHITAAIVANEATPQVSGHLIGILHPIFPRPNAGYVFEPATTPAQPLNTKSFVRGIFGAPVFFGDSLLGFVAAMRDLSRLEVAGIGSLVNDRGFTKACRRYMRAIPRLDLLPARASVQAEDARAGGGPADRRPPRVFISHAHKDDDGTHAEQVRKLGKLLRAEGIDVRLDYFTTGASRGYIAWMRQEMETADVILVIASPAYKRRAENPEADPSVGVAFEARLLRIELAYASTNESQRILPVLLPGSTSKDLPAFLRPLHPLVINPITRTGADHLLHRLTRGSPGEHRTDPADQARRAAALAEHDWRRGHRAEALATGEHAIEIYRRLASDNPVAYQPILVTNLLTHSDRLAETGRSDMGLRVAHEAVDISENRARSDPDTFRSTIPMALSTLSNRLAETSQPQQALAAAVRAVVIQRELAGTGRLTHRYDLARSLSNLSTRLISVGRYQDALSAINEAVSLSRQLAETNPDAVRADFATILNIKGAVLRKAGRPTEAVNAIEDAVLVYRRLAQIDPESAIPGLASTLLHSGSALSEAGRHREALSTTEEAVALYRQSAATSPDTLGPRLAAALHNLSLRLSETERSVEALTTIDEAIAIRRRLVANNPDAFLPDLAQSLSAAASLRARQRQDSDRALDSANEAVEIFHRLAAQLPAVFTTGLNQAQLVQAAILDKLGRSDEANQVRSPARSTPEKAMAVRIQTEHGDPEELQSVLQQLEEEPALRGRVLLVKQPAQMEPTSAVDLTVLQVAVLGGQGLASLGAALKVWLMRRKAHTVVNVTTAEGRHVTVSSDRPDEVRAALESLAAHDVRPSNRSVLGTIAAGFNVLTGDGSRAIREENIHVELDPHEVMLPAELDPWRRELLVKMREQRSWNAHVYAVVKATANIDAHDGEPRISLTVRHSDYLNVHTARQLDRSLPDGSTLRKRYLRGGPSFNIPDFMSSGVCAHVAVVTADDFLVVSRHHRSIEYMPQSWREPVAEMMNRVRVEDVEPPSLHATARRGLAEELSLRRDQYGLHLLAFGLTRSLTWAGLFLAELNMTWAHLSAALERFNNMHDGIDYRAVKFGPDQVADFVLTEGQERDWSTTLPVFYFALTKRFGQARVQRALTGLDA